MTAYFKDNIPCTQFILNKPDLIVTRVRVQSVLKNLYSPPLELDVDSSVVDEMRELIIDDERMRSAITMLDDGLLPLDKIAAYSSLPLATVNHLAAQRAALV